MKLEHIVVDISERLNFLIFSNFLEGCSNTFSLPCFFAICIVLYYFACLGGERREESGDAEQRKETNRKLRRGKLEKE